LNKEGKLNKKFLLCGVAVLAVVLVAVIIALTGKKEEKKEEVKDFGPPINNPDIRVLIMTNDFADITHPVMEVSAAGGMEITYGEEKSETEPGKKESFAPDDPRFGKEDENVSIRIRAKDDGEITLHSIQRAYGTPSYAGIIELRSTEEGIVVINELPLEKYLCKVVPSEMPFYYEPEALKAQAVCARNYAYQQTQQEAYPEYEAQINDSTRYQVYGNCQEDEVTNKAVKETENQVIRFEGELIETFFFSTSCGHTAGLEAWGTEDNAASRYLKSVEVKDEDGDYEAQLPWYKWEIKMPADLLSGLISTNTETEIGTLQDIEITKTGEGGIALQIKATGDKGTVTVDTENKIRKALGGSGFEITKQDGTAEPGSALLPSAFFTIKKEGDTFVISGGGLGHGIGMSQNGANEMAKKGRDYKEILSLFFQGVTVGDEDPGQP